ncbi:MAG TPA: hypothetical protein G4O02_04400 [Caldilineae bacterium]|nr:hypothetical protein [Caldilineae bacterium]
MCEADSLSLSLSPEERELIALLREEMGLPDDEAVLHMLVRQAAQRVAITCPSCGHYAKRTAEDEARCRSCLSVIKLVEGIWQVSG